MNHLSQPELWSQIRCKVQPERLLATAKALIDVPSPTGEAGPVSDRLADMLQGEGFQVDRPTGGYPHAPAVAVTLNGTGGGKVLQFDGHLDTVHLPFVPSRVEGDWLRGSGSSDMKAGVAAAVEALRVIRELGLAGTGGVLLTAHDLHEAPWGDGSQHETMIREGIHGDAVLIPEYTSDFLPVIGRGNSVFKIRVSRNGEKVHEVYRPTDQPHPISLLGKIVQAFDELGIELSKQTHETAGSESLFLGQIHCGEIYNQFPVEGELEGTRRWLPGRSAVDVERQLREVLSRIAQETGGTIEMTFQVIRDAFELPTDHPVVEIFQSAVSCANGAKLPPGAKPFVDDGSSFWKLAGIPAITHGPQGGGAHTLEEWVSISDLSRVAAVYALTAGLYCR